MGVYQVITFAAVAVMLELLDFENKIRRRRAGTLVTNRLVSNLSAFTVTSPYSELLPKVLRSGCFVVFVRKRTDIVDNFSTSVIQVLQCTRNWDYKISLPRNISRKRLAVCEIEDIPELLLVYKVWVVWVLRPEEFLEDFVSVASV
jgi:hypothetical protein